MDYSWEAYVGRRIYRFETRADGTVYVELDDGRGVVLGRPQQFVVSSRYQGKPILDFIADATGNKDTPV